MMNSKWGITNIGSSEISYKKYIIHVTFRTEIIPSIPGSFQKILEL